jgi:hypothetical protein
VALPAARRGLPRLTLRSARGDLSTYLAATIVLPLLLVAGAGGTAVAGLAVQQAQLAEARSAGLLAAEVAGGVTPAVTDQVLATLQGLGMGSAGVTVTGTPGPVAWGQPIQLTVTRTVVLSGFPWNLIGMEGRTVTLGGTTTTTSNAMVPS